MLSTRWGKKKRLKNGILFSSGLVNDHWQVMFRLMLFHFNRLFFLNRGFSFLNRGFSW